jgi:hypothetical protein
MQCSSTHSPLWSGGCPIFFKLTSVHPLLFLRQQLWGRCTNSQKRYVVKHYWTSKSGTSEGKRRKRLVRGQNRGFFYRLQRQGNSKVQDTMVERIGDADDEDECRSIDSGVGALGSSTTVWPVEHDSLRTLRPRLVHLTDIRPVQKYPSIAVNLVWA